MREAQLKLRNNTATANVIDRVDAAAAGSEPTPNPV